MPLQLHEGLILHAFVLLVTATPFAQQVFDRVCARLPQRCRLTAVMDCCHSGTVMDLPYTFKANKANMANIFVNGKFNAAGLPQMLMSQKWDLTNKKKMKKQVYMFGTIGMLHVSRRD